MVCNSIPATVSNSNRESKNGRELKDQGEANLQERDDRHGPIDGGEDRLGRYALGRQAPPTRRALAQHLPASPRNDLDGQDLPLSNVSRGSEEQPRTRVSDLEEGGRETETRKLNGSQRKRVGDGWREQLPSLDALIG
ncbi:hypothetical protein BHE74_00018354 [Ensete ventricosum]|nr:hypothetical protein BHE74_00018354 [Ensete ventricosum]